jgi:predicted transcriptional regulator
VGGRVTVAEVAPRVRASYAGNNSQETGMMSKLIVASILVPGLIGAPSYYVVQKTKTQKCAVVAKKPAATSKTTVLVGSGTAYKTLKEARAEMATIAACKRD